MGRASSLLALLACAALSRAQSFGRFGYVSSPAVPGFRLDGGGFAADYPSADAFGFPKRSSEWRPFETTETHQVVGLSGAAGGPSKLRIDLTAPGFSLYCPKGLSLDLSSTGAPYLSWTEGSVGAKVPTPDLRWLVISFSNRQPALIIGLPGGGASFVVEGRPGQWKLRGDAVKGWVRIGLVSGIRPIEANTAHALGELMERAKRLKDLYTQMPPKPIRMKLTSDPLSVTATWTFDRPGALVPIGASMAGIGGYPLKVLSETRSLDAATKEGPIEALKGTDLTIRFPTKRIPAGRALVADSPAYDPLGTVSPIDIPSVVELAFDNLVSTCDAQCRKQAEDAYADYLSQAAYVEEPWTKQKLPYAASGTGLDLAAAHALLNQSVTSTLKPTSEANSLLSSVVWRRDWSTWQIWTDDRTIGRRAAALAAVTACLCPEPERRLDGAMLEAGLAAERGAWIWLRRRGFAEKEPDLLEPLEPLRRVLFTAGHTEDSTGLFGLSLLSPLRVYGTTAVKLLSASPNYTLVWQAVEPKPSLLSFASGYPISLAPKTNLTSFSIRQAFGLSELLYVPEGVGACEATLTLPSWARTPPKGEIVPAYSETVR